MLIHILAVLPEDEALDVFVDCSVLNECDFRKDDLGIVMKKSKNSKVTWKELKVIEATIDCYCQSRTVPSAS